MYGGAGNSYDTTKSFASAGNAKDAISGALDLIYSSKVDGVNFNLILNSAQYRKLSTNLMPYTNKREWELVMELLNENDKAPSKGSIYKSPYITAGTGLLSPADPDGEFIELLVGQPITNDIGRDSTEPGTSPLYGKTYEKIGAHLIHPEAVCKLTDIAWGVFLAEYRILLTHCNINDVTYAMGETVEIEDGGLARRLINEGNIVAVVDNLLPTEADGIFKDMQKEIIELKAEKESLEKNVKKLTDDLKKKDILIANLSVKKWVHEPTLK